MRIGDWPSTAELNKVFRDAQDHGLVEHLAELEAFGFTVVPPEKVAAPDLHARLEQALIGAHERRTGQRLDLGSGTVEDTGRPFFQHLQLLYEDRAFEEAVLHPAVSTISRYLCGKSVTLSDVQGIVKCRREDQHLETLHVEQMGTPPPLPSYAQTCNVTWILTDYTPENGPVAVVPGSHRFGRHPADHEADWLSEGAPIKPVPVEAPAGSLVAFTGATWHTSWPRSAPGLRVSVSMLFCRSYMRPIQDYRRVNPCPPEIIARNPPEFAALLGLRNPLPLPGDNTLPVDELEVLIDAQRNPWA